MTLVPDTHAAQVKALAELIVADVGVNVRPGQVVGITAEPGMEDIWRAVAEAAYLRGATYVDTWIFDGYVKHSRLVHAPLDTLGYRPPWWGDRLKAIGALNGAAIRLSGQPNPTLMDDIPGERLGLDMMPRLPETLEIVHARQWNWIVAPGPSAGWAAGLYPDLSPDAAVEKMWEELSFVMRLNEPDPTAAWRRRFARLKSVATWLNERRFDSLHFEGPGTDLSVGLLPGSIWKEAGSDETAAGIPFTANLPTEEIFTAPDPLRVDGHVASTKPLVVGGGVVRGLKVGFTGGRAVSLDADQGVDLVRTMVARDEGAARLGEVALVDGESRIGQLGTVFYETLFDENSASHVALGAAYPDTVDCNESRSRLNDSSIHIDFMIGSRDVSVTGVSGDGTRVLLLRGGEWQFQL